MTFPRRFRLRCVALCLAAASCSTAHSSADEPPPSEPGANAARLVDQLGSAAFADRESASKQILALGTSAVPALQSAASHPSLEVRRRAGRLLTDLERRQHDQRLAELQKSPDQTPDDRVPGLKRYRETIGRDGASMALFVDMCRAEPELFRLSEAGGRDLEQAYDSRSGEVQFEINVLQNRSKIADRVAAMMFVAADPDLKESDVAANLVYSLAHQNEFRQAMTTGPAAPAVKKVVGQWVRKPGGMIAYQKLTLALTLDIPDGIIPAVEMAKGPNVGGQAQFAVLAIARFGNREHLPLVEKLLKDTTLLSTNVTNNKVSYTCEMRDVALAALIHLTGQDPKVYGFSQLQKNPQWVFSPNTAGFANSSDRDAALKKWTEWRAANE